MVLLRLALIPMNLVNASCALSPTPARTYALACLCSHTSRPMVAFPAEPDPCTEQPIGLLGIEDQSVAAGGCDSDFSQMPQDGSSLSTADAEHAAVG